MAPRTHLVDRLAEQAAIAEALESAQSGSIRVIAIVGEPGIGKSRLLEAAGEGAKKRDFVVASAAADEELRGPFFLATTLLRSPGAFAATSPDVRQDLDAAVSGLSGAPVASNQGISGPEGILLAFDRVAAALRALADQKPVALLLDDLQWTDDDSLRLLRYIVRTSGTSRLFIGLAVRHEPGPATSSALDLITDLERLRLARRLSPDRLSQAETAEILQAVLEGPVSPQAVVTLHERSEGVPFFAEELARALTEARILRLVEGTWRVVQGTNHLVPASVQSLIERRLGRLPPDTRAALSDAAILGRTVSLGVLARVCTRLRAGQSTSPDELSARLAPAVAAGLLSEMPESAADDYSFTHNQVRDVLSAAVDRQRRRDIHAAVVELLESGEDRSPTRLAALARHAIAAGRAESGLRYSLEAARASLRGNAPEEALRLTEEALPAAIAPDDRVALLRMRDEALATLGRGSERTASLAQLAAITHALHDPALELEVLLRRAAAARQMADHERAAELATEARRLAADRGDAQSELLACLELGQARLHSPLGEGYMLNPTEDDLEGAQEAYRGAAELARRLGDEAGLAGATRELGLVENGRARVAFLEVMKGPVRPHTIEDIPAIVEPLVRARKLFGEAIELYVKLGDRRGAMSSVIGLAYAHISELSRGRGTATVYEQIRRLRMNLDRLSSPTERAASEARMLYATHTYARLFHHPDIALERGVEAYGAARAIGDRRLEFLAAGGLTLEHVILGEPTEAERWLARAESAAETAAGSLAARRLELWRGLVRGAAGDGAACAKHFERALDLVTRDGTDAERCDVQTTVALQAALRGAMSGADHLLAQAESAAHQILPVARSIAGQHPWEARAEAALAQVALARGQHEVAIPAAQRAIAAFQRVDHIAAFDPELLLVVLRALEGLEGPEVEFLRGDVRHGIQLVAQWTLDEQIRQRWFSAPVQWELTRLVGGLEARPEKEVPRGLTEQEVRLLRLSLSGKTEPEIATDMELSEGSVARARDAVFHKLGVASHDEARIVAVAEGIT